MPTTRRSLAETISNIAGCYAGGAITGCYADTGHTKACLRRSYRIIHMIEQWVKS